MPRPTRWLTPNDTRKAIANGDGRGVRIGVLDTGIEWTHPGLANLRVSDDLAIVEDDGQLKARVGGGIDVFGHGTAVAGIIHEIAPAAEICSMRVLDIGNAARSETICEGARVAMDRGCHILNCSFGARLRQHVLMFKEWVDRAYLENRHVIAACNNEDYHRQEWPGDFSSVITVKMMNAPDPALAYRNPPGTMVEFAAHGVNVRVAWKDGGSMVTSGSSFAAPRITGLLARLLSVYPLLSSGEAKALLLRVAEPMPPACLARHV
jgi:subtilisin family serine protease